MLRMFDFVCNNCQFKFEELVSGEYNPDCPNCEGRTERQVCAPHTTFRFADRKAFKTSKDG